VFTLNHSSNSILENSYLKNHLFVILIFIALTGFFTYPSYFEFDKAIGGYGDSLGFRNIIWWYDFNFNHSENPWDLSWLFYNDYRYYPNGYTIYDGAHFNTFLSIPLMQIFQNSTTVYNILIYSGFIFSGYGTFLLTRHLTKNYIVSIVAGIIFTFGIFHMVHATSHLPYVTTQFIPFSILFLLKTTESKNIKYAIIAGICLFLLAITSLYFIFFMVFFILAFIVYLILKKEKLSTFAWVGIVILISLSIMAPFFYFQYNQTIENVSSGGFPLGNYVGLSPDLMNYFLPTKLNSIYQIGDNSNGFSFGNRETWSFLGYTAIILAIIGILKTDFNKKLLWIISGIFLLIISLGPVLKISGHITMIPLPYYFLYDEPVFNLFRGIGRASIFVTLSISILAAFGMKEILKIQSISNNQKKLIVLAIIILLAAEYATIPFLVSEPKPIPQVYRDISNDSREVAILESPMGSSAKGIDRFGIARDNLYFQTIHEKPIFSGHASRVSTESEKYLQTYFLNYFIWDQSTKDIVKQNLSDVGISIFNYYNIGYVVVNSKVEPINRELMEDHIKNTWIPQTNSLLMEIFNHDPDYKDKNLFAYKVPTSTSITPFIVLSDGWSPFWNDSRSFGEMASLNIINPDERKDAIINLKFMSLLNNTVNFKHNDKNILELKVNQQTQYFVSIPLKLEPGKNEIFMSSEFSSPVPIFYTLREKMQPGVASLLISEISLKQIDEDSIFEINIEKFNDDPFKSRNLIAFKINDVFIDVLNRNATPKELNVYSNSILNNNRTIEWLYNTLETELNQEKNNSN